MNISKRAQGLIANPSPIVVGFLKCVEDPYSEDNTQGYLNFGVAQNFLMEKESVKFVKENNYFTDTDIHYNAACGKLSLREAFSTFANTFLATSSCMT